MNTGKLHAYGASDLDRDKMVVEIRCGERDLGVIDETPEGLRLTLYGKSEEPIWLVSVDELRAALEYAQSFLGEQSAGDDSGDG